MNTERASALLTDLYQNNMMQAYLDHGETKTAVFEFFVRSLPARRVDQLRHPNIVSIHEIGRADREPYFTMDYVEGIRSRPSWPAAGPDRHP